MINHKFKQNKLALSVSMLVASTVGGLVTPMAVAEEQEVQEVMVTGLRGSLMRAQAMKQENTSIVEALSAEDIGKLPDTSIAESLSRLPGLSGERRDGRTSGLSVRGFREDYVGTMLNGREILGIGDNRGVEYDLYPSEIMANGIVIYKSPDAALMSQGIGGTVDLRTNRPLDADAFLSINGLYEMNDLESGNDDFDDTGHRIAVSYSDSFADDTFGVSFTVASLESPSQEQQFRGWGYADSNQAPGNKVLGGHDSFNRSGLLERDTVALILQSRPMDNFTATLDLLYIDFQEEKVFRGIEEGGAEWGTGNYTVNSVGDGLVTSGTIDGGFQPVIRNDAERKEAELKTGGLLLEYEFSEKWSGKLDFGYGETDKTISNIESYSGMGRPNIADSPLPNTVRSWTMTGEGAVYNTEVAPYDPADFDEVILAGPQSWGGGLVNYPAFQADPNSAFPNVGPTQAQDGFINEPRFDEELSSFRVEATYLFESDFFDKINFGYIYSDRTKEKTNEGFYTTAPEFPGQGPVPEQYRVGVTSLDFIGIPGIVAYDTLAMIDEGYYTSTAASQFEADRLGDTYTIDETLETFFVKVDILAALSDVEVRGNMGAQYVSTDQSSDGFQSLGLGAGFECNGVLHGGGGVGTFTTGFDGEVCASPVSGGEEYDKILPSMNLSFDFGDGHTVRTAISKTISRPRLDNMRASSAIRFTFGAEEIQAESANRSSWSSTSGNPTLKPLEANQFDLSYEWYYAADAFFSVSFFYKDLVNWHRSAEEIVDFSDAYVQGFHQVTDRNGTTILVPTTDPSLDSRAPGGVDFDPNADIKFFNSMGGKLTTTADGLTGFVRGWEYQVTFPFHLVSEALDGLGMVFGYSNSDGLLSDGFKVPGLSDETFQFTAFYEIGGFEARVSGRKRSDFATETRGGSLALVPTEDQGSELWDAQIAYDFGKAGYDNWLGGLSLSLQGQNLTDEDTIQTEAGDARQILKYQTFGANYLLGFRYKF